MTRRHRDQTMGGGLYARLGQLRNPISSPEGAPAHSRHSNVLRRRECPRRESWHRCVEFFRWPNL